MSTLPVYFDRGTGVTSQTAISPGYPAGIALNDVALMFVQTAHQAVAIIPTGWAEVYDSALMGTGTPGTAGSTRLTVLWKRLDGTETAQSIGDSGDHQMARIVVFRGCITVGDPWDVTVGDIQAVAQTLVEIPGRTTTVDNCLIVLAAAHAVDTVTPQYVAGSIDNPDLTNLTQRTALDQTSGTGGGFFVATGEMVTAGTFGETTAQFATATAQGHIVIALKPVPPPTPGIGQLVLTGLPPTVLTPRVAKPGVGALTLTGLAPNIPQAGLAHPGVGQLVLTGLAPIMLGSAPAAVTPSVGNITITGLAPTVIVGKYFVSNTGSDLANGRSPSTAWQHLSMLSTGAAFLGPDDVVRLECGSRFPETLTIKTVGNTGGTAGHPITFTSYGSGVNPIISGADISTNWVFDQVVAGGDRWVLPGGPAVFPNQGWREAGTDGTGIVRNFLPQSASVAACTALDAWRNDTAGSALYVVLATGEVPGLDVTIHLGARSSNIVPTTGGEDYITLSHLTCQFTNSTTTQAIQMDQDSQAANGWVFDDVLVEWTNGNGMRFGGQGTNDYTQPRVLTMRNSTFRYCRDSGCQANYLTTGSLIENCTFYANGRQGFGFAMYRGTVRNCTFDYNANALDKWTASSSVQSYDDGCRCVGSSPPGAPNWIPAGENLIVDCWATGNARKGFATDVMSNNNIFLRIVSRLNGIFGLFFEGGTDSSAYGNAVYDSTFWGNLGAGFAVYNGHGGFTCKNCQIYGNCTNGNAQDVTIGFTLGTLTATWPVHSGAIYKHEHMLYDPINFKADTDLLTRVASVAAMTAGTWCYVSETVYAWKHDSSAVILGWTNPAWTMDYNNYTPVAELTPTGHNIFGYGSATTGLISGLLASIRSTFGQELNGQQVNPLYLNAAGGDFHLSTPHSPSIDAGLAIAGINDGTSGARMYVGSAPDIGAFEAALVVYGPIPTVDQVGTEVSGTAGVTVQWPTHVAGRIGILVAATCQETVATPSGWTLIAYKGNGPAGSPTSAGLTMWWQRATSSSMPDAVLADPGDHVVAVIFTVQDCIEEGNPVNVSGSSAASFTTAVSQAGLTTTAPHCLVVVGVANTADTATPQASGWTNADLANPSLTEVVDVGTTQGNGSGLSVAAGGKLLKGAFGTTTATLATSSSQGKIVFALLSTIESVFAPDVGALVLTGLAPTVVVAPAAALVQPGVGQLVLTGLAPTVGPRTYFVSTKPGEVGDDTLNNGLTSSTPWRTLAKLSTGAAFLGPGDTVKLNCGSVFPETLTIKTVGNLGGTVGKPITYTSYGSGIRPIISGANIPTGWVFDTAVAGGDRYKLVGALGYFPNQGWVESGLTGDGTVRNLRAQSATVAAVTALDAWRNDLATLTTYVVVATGDVPGVTMTIHLAARNTNIGLTDGGESYLTLQNLICRFTNSTTTNALEFAQDSKVANGWVLDNLLVEWGDSNGMRFGGQGTNDYSQTRVFTMTDCVFRYHRASGAQINYVTAGSLIDGCTFYGNGRQGLGIAMSDGVISNCTFDYNARALNKWTVSGTLQAFDDGCRIVGSSPPGAPNWVPSQNNVIKDCSATGNGFQGFATDVLAYNHTFLRCVSTLNGTFGFHLEGGTDSGSYGNAVYHCTAWGNVNAGLCVNNGHGSFTAKNNQLHGNGTGGNAQLVSIEFKLVALTPTWDLHSGAIYKRLHTVWDPVLLATTRGTLLTHVSAIPTAPGQWWWDAPTETLYIWKTDSSAVTEAWAQPAWEMDYNNYTPSGQLPSNVWLMGTGTASVPGGVISVDLADLQADHPGQEVHGQQVDPLYLDTAHGNFRLGQASPSIDAGVVIAGINDGTGGSPMYLGAAPDIGAFEGFAIIPGVGSLILTGLAPTVIVPSGPMVMTPGVGQLILAGLAPTVGFQNDVYAWFPGDDSYRPGRRYEDIPKETPKKKKRKRKKPERIPTPLQPLAMPFPAPLVLPPPPLSQPGFSFPAPAPLPMHPPRVVVPPPVVPPPPPESADPEEYKHLPIDPEDEARAMALLMKLIGH